MKKIEFLFMVVIITAFAISLGIQAKMFADACKGIVPDKTSTFEIKPKNLYFETTYEGRMRRSKLMVDDKSLSSIVSAWAKENQHTNKVGHYYTTYKLETAHDKKPLVQVNALGAEIEVVVYR